MQFYRPQRKQLTVTIIPLIDIFAILLIFFIVSTTFKKPRPILTIDLPTVKEMPSQTVVDERAVLAVAPDGTVDRRIDLPVELPTMPCFGGANLDTLFITSINSGDDDPESIERRQGVAAGSLLAIDLSGDSIQGCPDALFAGTHP